MTPIRPGLALVMLILAGCQFAPTAAPISPTATPEATPSALPSPIPPPAADTVAPAPRYFTEDFSGRLPSWDFRQVNNGQLAGEPAVQAGFLVFDLPAADQWAYDLYRPEEYSDVRVEARVQIRSGEHAAAGVICRYSASAGWYELNVFGDQTVVLLYGHWLADGIAGYSTLMQIQSEKVQPQQNDIGLLCNSKTLTPLINGVALRQYSENLFQLAGGKVGLTASSFETTPTTIAYDWVKVSAP